MDISTLRPAAQALGGRIRYLVSGGAPLSQEVFDFLRGVFNCPVLEAYGTTETSGGLCITHGLETIAGISGGPLASLKIKLVDIPKFSYLSTDDPPRGQIYVKGAAVFKGYFKDEKATKKYLSSDGWFKTGDVGMLLRNGTLKVIDRIKNIGKT